MSPETFAIASWLVEHRGCSVIPLDHPAETLETDPARIGKVPRLKTWKMFQEVRPTADNLRSWFGNGHHRNVGIVTGAVSNLVVVDCDSPQALAWADTHLPPTPWVTRTAKGEHRGYRHPGVPVRNKTRIRTGDPEVKVDVRGDAGYVVAPGSLHASGVMYERAGTWPQVDELPLFDPTWLEVAQVEAPPPAPRPPRTSTDDQVGRRVAAYVEKADAAIEGGGGDAHTYTLCCRLVRGFNLTVDQALDALRAWNARCSPPWSERELRKKLENALKYGDEPIGARLDHAPPVHVHSGQPHERTIPAQKAAAPVVVATGLVSIGDFLAQDDPAADYVVDNLIARGTINLLVSKPKVGKSCLARALALAVAQGREEFLGFAVKPGTVWYLALEGRAQDHREHFRQLGAKATDPLRVFCGQVPQKALDQIRAWSQAEVPDVILVDTLQRFIRASDTDNYAELSNLFDPIIALSRELGCALLFLHHARKMADGGLSLDAVHGSVAISGSVDNTILLSRTGPIRTLATVQRIGIDVEECLLLLDDDGWPYLGGSKADAEREVVAQELLAALQAAGLALCRDDWFERVEGRTQVKVASLRLLDQQHCLDRQGTGRKGDPYLYRPVPGKTFQSAGNRKRTIHPAAGFGDSCSAVPPYGWEQESRQPETSVSPYSDGENACSRFHSQSEGGQRTPIFGNRQVGGAA